MHEPAITVLMPVYNGAPYLREAIESILQQTYPHFRFLIVDDASTDDSRDIVRSYDDPRIDLLALPQNVGQIGAMNQGLATITTPLVARLDADDISLPTRLEKQVAFMQQHPDVVLLGTWYKYIDHMGNYLYAGHPPVAHRDLVAAFADDNPFAHSSVVFRRDVVQDLGGFPSDYAYGEDFALWLMLSERGQIANVPEELIMLRLHTQSKSSTMGVVRAWDRVRLMQCVLQHPELPLAAQQRCRCTIARLLLEHAAIASDIGQMQDALRSGMLFLRHYAPACFHNGLVMKHVVRVLAGPRGRQLVRRFTR